MVHDIGNFNSSNIAQKVLEIFQTAASFLVLRLIHVSYCTIVYSNLESIAPVRVVLLMVKYFWDAFWRSWSIKSPYFTCP